jgi:hypothetical protein
VGEVLSTIGDGLSFGFQMAWEVWWALILAMVIAALAIDLLFSAPGLVPETRPSIESIPSAASSSTTPRSLTSSSRSSAPRCCG